MKNIEKKNFIWNMLGSMIFGFTSLLFLMIATRINGIDVAGDFAYCFATACILYTVAAYAGKTFQLTDKSKKFYDSDYIYNKAYTCVLAILFSLIFALLTKLNLGKILLLLTLTIYRSSDAFIEVFHAVTQINGELYKVGKSLFFRTIAIIGTFLLLDYFTNSIYIATLSLILINFLFFIFYDYPVAKKNLIVKKYSSIRNKKLFIDGFFVFIFSFLSIYLPNAPKYLLEFNYDSSIQGIYGIIVLPASFIALVANYMVQPFLVKIAENIKENKINNLKKLLLKLSLAIIILGLVCIIGGWLLGIPILELLYDVDLGKQKINFIIILIGSIFYALSVLLYSVLIAMRKSKMQLLSLVIDSILGIIICYWLIGEYELFGASLSYLLIMLIQFLLYYLLIIYYFKKFGVKHEKL